MLIQIELNWHQLIKVKNSQTIRQTEQKKDKQDQKQREQQGLNHKHNQSQLLKTIIQDGAV